MKLQKDQARYHPYSRIFIMIVSKKGVVNKVFGIIGMNNGRENACVKNLPLLVHRTNLGFLCFLPMIA